MATKRILRILGHSQGCFLAEALLHSTEMSTPQEKRTTQCDCCLHCDFLRHEMDCSDWEEFHWKHAMQYLVEPGIDEQCPRFFCLGTATQHNLLILVHHQMKYISLNDIKVFCAQLLHYRESDCDSWLQFLIQNLYLKLPPDWIGLYYHSAPVRDSISADQAVLHTSLSNSMVRNIQELGTAFGALSVSGPVHHSELAIPLPQADSEFWKLKLVSVEPEAKDQVRTVTSPMDVGTTDCGVPMQGELSATVEAKEEKSPLNTSTMDCSKFSAVEILDRWSDGQHALSEDFQVLSSLRAAQLHAVFDEFEDFDRLSTGIITALTALCESSVEVGGEALTSRLRCSLLPLLLKASKCTPRALQACLSLLHSRHPMPTTSGVLLPLITHNELNMAQADLLCKLIKDSMSVEQATALWRSFISPQKEESHLWNESTVMVVQTLMDKKVDVVNAECVVRLLQRNADNLSRDKKFAKLIINLCKQYGPELHSFGPKLLAIAADHKSMMKNAVCRAVKNL